MADVITPNLPEAAILLNQPVEALLGADRSVLETACKNLSAFGRTGGCSERRACKRPIRCWICSIRPRMTGFRRFESKRIETRNTHGTGCTLSAAIAAHLAKGHPLEEAVLQAKTYITGALEAGAAYQLGNGHGPVHHFYGYWK